MLALFHGVVLRAMSAGTELPDCSPGKRAQTGDGEQSKRHLPGQPDAQGGTH